MAGQKAKQRTAPKKPARAVISPLAKIKAVRELRSGVGTFEIPPAVNDLLQRGWMLLGADFVTLGTDDRQSEFLYVLGSTDPALAEPEGDTHFSDLENSVRNWHNDQVTSPRR